MIPYKQYNMKHIIAETKINKSNISLISTIPNTIVSLESLTNTDGIRWSYEIINNKHQYTIEFIKDIKNNENNKKTSSNIDDTTEKQDKTIIKHLSSIDTSSDTLPVTSETDDTTDESFEDTKKKLMKELHRDEKGNSTIIKDLHESDEDEVKRYKELLSTNSNRITNNDNIYTISIQKNQRKGKLTFKLNFKTTINKNNITNITYQDGSLNTAIKTLYELELMNKDEVNTFILKNNPQAKTNLEKYGLIHNQE